MRQKAVWAVLAMTASLWPVTIGMSTSWSFLDQSSSYTTPVPVWLTLDFFQNDGTTPLLDSDIILNLSASTVAAFWYDPSAASEVPEPASLVLLGTGIFVVARRIRRVKSGDRA